MSAPVTDADLAALKAAYPGVPIGAVERGDLVVSSETNAAGDVVRVDRYQKYHVGVPGKPGEPKRVLAVKLVEPDAKDAEIASLKAQLAAKAEKAPEKKAAEKA
jgi:hypothetical protein